MGQSSDATFLGLEEIVKGNFDDSPELKRAMTDSLVLATFMHDLEEMTKDRDTWRKALNDCTPGGSEFARDPKYCMEYVRKRWDMLWNSNKKFVLKQQKMQKSLDAALKVLHLVQGEPSGATTEIRALARDTILLIQEEMK